MGAYGLDRGKSGWIPEWNPPAEACHLTLEESELRCAAPWRQTFPLNGKTTLYASSRPGMLSTRGMSS